MRVSQILDGAVDKHLMSNCAKEDVYKVNQSNFRVIGVKVDLGGAPQCHLDTSVPFDFSHLPNYIFHFYVTIGVHHIHLQHFQKKNFLQNK